MIEALLIVTVGLMVVSIILLFFLLTKKVTADLSPIHAFIQSVQLSYEKTERTVRAELSANRSEASIAFQNSREELVGALKEVSGTLNKQNSDLTQSIKQWLQFIHTDNGKKLDQMREDSATNAKTLREEVGASLRGFSDSIVKTTDALGSAQRIHLGSVVEQLTKLTESNEKKLDAQREESTKKLDQMREESGINAKQMREEVGANLKEVNGSIVKTMDAFGSAQRIQLGVVSEQLTKLTESNEKKLDAQREESTKKLDQMREESGINAKQMREEVGKSLKDFNDSVLKGMGGMADVQKGQMEIFSVQLEKMTESNQQKLDALKVTVEERLKGIQEDNTKQLDQMRGTVDEKLQGTLEKRLGESFKLVGDQLEQVHKGLGEMQSLASGVGDLKRVLTNVKTRGTWGEAQLGAILEQVLSPGQYATNVATRENSDARVEFVINLPGRNEDTKEVVWLPIDAKFPTEDYQRLVEAQENADPLAAEAATKQLETRIKACAKDICEKYINPPRTTDFAILFLPTEGLFAEVVRRLGLTESIQREYHVIVAGPTTLYSILNSLQMGFRTLTIQKRSSEVWNLLGAVKTEFGKYGDVLVKVQKKLHEATSTIDTVEGRTRVIIKRLRDVQELPTLEASSLLQLAPEGGKSSFADDA